MRVDPAPLPQFDRREVPAARGTPWHLTVAWASCEAEVRLAQRLRYQVFAEEMHARLSPVPGTPAGLDADRFDPHCDHLLVRVGGGGDAGPGDVVGTYRVLPPAGARAAGGLYGDGEFDLGPLRPLRPRAVELGRSCVHAGWRHGGVILAMWGALAAYMQTHQLETMIGCASMGVADGGIAAASLWMGLQDSHLVEPRWRVRPHAALPLPSAPRDLAGSFEPSQAPALIKGYLRCGARLLGPPAFDPAFNTADLPMMLRMEDLAPRYRNHLLRVQDERTGAVDGA